MLAQICIRFGNSDWFQSVINFDSILIPFWTAQHAWCEKDTNMDTNLFSIWYLWLISKRDQIWCCYDTFLRWYLESVLISNTRFVAVFKIRSNIITKFKIWSNKILESKWDQNSIKSKKIVARVDIWLNKIFTGSDVWSLYG